MSELENMTLLELRNFAKERNIKNISKLKKEDLIEVLGQVLNKDNIITDITNFNRSSVI